MFIITFEEDSMNPPSKFDEFFTAVISSDLISFTYYLNTNIHLWLDSMNIKYKLSGNRGSVPNPEFKICLHFENEKDLVQFRLKFM